MAEPIVATKQMIEQVFDGAAARYDCEGPSIFQQFGARLVEWLLIEPGARVLDVATGKGAVLIPAARRVGASGHVVGADLSAAMVREAERAAQHAGLANVELRKMDAEHLEFPDASFDLVTCAFSLFLFPAIELALREMWRVLIPGGVIGATVFGTAPPPFDPAWKMFAEQARAYEIAVRTPQRVTYTTDEFGSLLVGAGFVQVVAWSETYEVVYPNEDDWWAFQSTLANRAAILRMSDETRARFKAEYLARVRPLFRADGLHLGVSVIYAAASRPPANPRPETNAL